MCVCVCEWRENGKIYSLLQCCHVEENNARMCWNDGRANNISTIADLLWDDGRWCERYKPKKAFPPILPIAQVEFYTFPLSNFHQSLSYLHMLSPPAVRLLQLFASMLTISSVWCIHIRRTHTQVPVESCGFVLSKPYMDYCIHGGKVSQGHAHLRTGGSEWNTAVRFIVSLSTTKGEENRKDYFTTKGLHNKRLGKGREKRQ